MSNRIGDYIAEIELGSEDDYYRYDGGDAINGELDVSVAYNEEDFKVAQKHEKVNMKVTLVRNVIFFLVFCSAIYGLCIMTNPYRAKAASVEA